MHTLRAFQPTNRANSIEIIGAWLIAECCLLLLFRLTDHGFTSCSAVRMLITGYSNVYHSLRTVWRANTASSVMKVFPAFGIPESSPLFTIMLSFFLLAILFAKVTSTSSIRSWFLTVSTIIPPVSWTSLPAHRTTANIAISAKRITKGSSLLFTFTAG